MFANRPVPLSRLNNSVWSMLANTCIIYHLSALLVSIFFSSCPRDLCPCPCPFCRPSFHPFSLEQATYSPSSFPSFSPRLPFPNIQHTAGDPIHNMPREMQSKWQPKNTKPRRLQPEHVAQCTSLHVGTMHTDSIEASSQQHLQGCSHAVLQNDGTKLPIARTGRVSLCKPSYHRFEVSGIHL